MFAICSRSGALWDIEGTGFWIAGHGMAGLFGTARHVLVDRPLWAVVSTDTGLHATAIVERDLHPVADVAVGVADLLDEAGNPVALTNGAA